MPNSYLFVLTVFETVLGLSCVLWLAYRARQERRSQGWKNLAPMAGMIACLTFSSHTYCMHFLHAGFYPRWVHLLGEICAPLHYICCALTLCRRFMMGRGWSRSQLAFSTSLFVACLLLAINYAVIPIQAAPESFDIYTRVISVITWPFYAVLLAIALQFSQQTMSTADTSFLLSVVLILIAAIATEAQLAVFKFELAPWAEILWALGFAGLALAVFLDAKSRAPLLHRPAELSEWFSLRSLIGLSVFGSSTVLLAGLGALRLLKVDNGSDLTLIFLLVYVSWCVSIFVAVALSRKIRDVRARMLAPATAGKTAFEAFTIRSVPQQTLLSEVDSIRACPSHS